jgi:hypothetical protein
MTSKEMLLREADAAALRDLARHTRRVIELANSDNQKKALHRHADDFDKQAGLLESEAAHARTMPMAPRVSQEARADEPARHAALPAQRS